MKKIIVILVMFCLGLTGCGQLTSPGEPVSNDGKETKLNRVIDYEAGIVCYNFAFKEGIFCFLVSETDLK